MVVWLLLKVADSVKVTTIGTTVTKNEIPIPLSSLLQLDGVVNVKGS